MRKFLIIASISGLIAVALGAMGSHSLSDKVSPEYLSQFKTGVEYQFYHTFALLFVVWAGTNAPGRGWTWPAWCFVAGIILFSGSLYILGTREVNGWSEAAKYLWPVTPAGGLMFMAGWLLLFIIGVKQRKA